MDERSNSIKKNVDKQKQTKAPVKAIDCAYTRESFKKSSTSNIKIVTKITLIILNSNIYHYLFFNTYLINIT